MATATQQLTQKKECKNSIVFAPAEGSKVSLDGKDISDGITSGIYVNRSILARLGDPKTITLTIQA